MQNDGTLVFQSPDPQLPPYGYALQTPGRQLDQRSTTPPSIPRQSTKKRKLDSFGDSALDYEGQDDHDGGANGMMRNGSNRKSRPNGTKRACNQCRQQKLKCNVVEDPWQSCDRCIKHKFKCEITADFKRVGKRSQQAELERSNEELSRQVEDLSNELRRLQQREEQWRQFEMRVLHPGNQMGEYTTDTPPRHDDGSHDAALLLNLKQSAGSDGNRATPIPMGRIPTPMPQVIGRIGDITIPMDVIGEMWKEYFDHYHAWLPVLDQKDTPEHVFDRSPFLFWTVIMIACRRYQGGSMFSTLLKPYIDLVNATITRPPTKAGHHVVKGLCLLCTWPIPISSTTEDMTFTLSGVMMKFAMHLGIHRPSNPSDFNNIPVNLRTEQITDRLKTWAICNLVAQNVSTGYGQPPETIYDDTLRKRGDEFSHILTPLDTRLEIEQVIDKITREIYCPRSAKMKTDWSECKVELSKLHEKIDFSNPLESLHFQAAQMHLNLQVFFEDHSSVDYQLALKELDQSVRNFINATQVYEEEIRYAPYYIYQMCVAAAAALLKLMNSFFGFSTFTDREDGVHLFWVAIDCIRVMSARDNDLPQRLGEVLAQMWNSWDAARTEGGVVVSESVAAGHVDSSLTLKRRYRMSMSHVFDSIWRWKEEMHGDRGKLKDQVLNPTSPIATTHRSSSFSNGRRPSLGLPNEQQHVDSQGISSFGGFGGMPLAQSDMSVPTNYDFFDPMGWYLNDLGGNFEGLGAPNGLGW
ncbi:hypothetical protein FKW77_003244 [Venturia effusa]|uniref:Zn(2)-C6 fungal-type domain-containing protein n=1 Tax=Venturia effusa TaxID=50376 RepID=A0A517L2X7_9PEZI|nr:hypothetical protein FKW77_003244 [Venturia effusa]